MTCTTLSVGIGACLMAMTTVAHAATPITLPFGDIGTLWGTEVALPLPPPPTVARPDVTRMRLVIKRQPRGCDPAEDTRRPAADRRQAITWEPAIDGPKPIRLG